MELFRRNLPGTASMWQAIQYVGTPLAALAFIVAAVGRAYWKTTAAKYKALDGVTDPRTRLEMLTAILGQYRPDVDNLRIDDKVNALDRDAQHRLTRFKWITIAGGICFALLLAAAVLVSIYAPPAQGGKAAASDGPAPPASPDRFARLDAYKGSSWLPKQVRFMPTFRRVEKLGDAPPPPPAPDDPLPPPPSEPDGLPELDLYPAVSFDLVNLSDRDDAVVQSIQVHYRPAPGKWVPVTGAFPHPNVRVPIRFQARLKKGAGTAEAELVDNEGTPVRDHLVKLTRAEPRAKVVVGFAGDTGPHRVHVEVAIREDRGDRTLALRTERCVWGFGVNPDPE